MIQLKVMTVIGAVWCTLLAASPVWAQAVAGSQVSGSVRDSSGGALPGAEVSITKTDTGAVRTVFTSEDGSYVIPNLPVGPYQLKVVLQGFNTYVQDGIVLQVSTNPQINVVLAVGAVSEQVTVTANATMVEIALDRHRPGHRQPARHRTAAQRPAGDRADLPRRPGDLGAGRGPQHQQELPDRDDLGRRRPGQRHHLHHGRRHAQRPVQQPEPADAVSRRAAGVQGGNQRAPGPLRPPCRVRRQPRDQVRHQQLHGSAFEFVRNYHFNARNAFAPERDSLKRNQFGGVLGGPVREEQGVLLRRLPGADRAQQSGDEHQLHPDDGDAQRRLHGLRVAGLQCRPPGGPDRRFHQQPDRSVAVEQRRAELREVPADRDRGSVRARAVRHPQQQHRAPGHRQGGLHAEQPPERPRPLPVRGLREPRHVRRPERAHAEPHRPEEPGALDRGRPQLAAVVVAHQLRARDLQQDDQRSPAAGVLHRHRSRQPDRQPARRLRGDQRDRKRIRCRQRRDESRVLQLRRLSGGRRRRRGAGQPSGVVRRQLDPHQDRDAQQPPDQRRVHLQRPEHGPLARRLHARRRERRLPAGEPGLRLRQPRLLRRLHPGRLEGPAEPVAERRRALGALHPAAQHVRLGEPLRSVALRSGPEEQRLSAGAGRAHLPR